MRTAMSTAMRTPSTALALWDHGRLALRGDAVRRLGPEQALILAIGVAAAIVFAVYVAVLLSDVHAADMAHAEQRARAIAEADCEATHAGAGRAGCVAMLRSAPATAGDAGSSADARFYAVFAGATPAPRATMAMLADTPR